MKVLRNSSIDLGITKSIFFIKLNFILHNIMELAPIEFRFTKDNILHVTHRVGIVTTIQCTFPNLDKVAARKMFNYSENGGQLCKGLWFEFKLTRAYLKCEVSDRVIIDIPKSEISNMLFVIYNVVMARELWFSHLTKVNNFYRIYHSCNQNGTFNLTIKDDNREVFTETQISIVGKLHNDTKQITMVQSGVETWTLTLYEHWAILKNNMYKFKISCDLFDGFLTNLISAGF